MRISYDTTRAGRRLAAAAVALSWLAAIGGCADARRSSLPDEYLGRWFHVGTSGGLTGKGTGDAPAGYIEIHADDTLTDHADDGALLVTTAFTVSRGPTIFSTADQWIVQRVGATPEVSALSDDGRTLTLSENVYDGFQRAYARSR